jgi:hypothetical protein
VISCVPFLCLELLIRVHPRKFAASLLLWEPQAKHSRFTNQNKHRGSRHQLLETTKMKRVLIVVILVVAAAVLGMWTRGGIRHSVGEAVGMASSDPQGDARDEIRRSFQLEPGARLDIQGINGAVEIETSDTKTAEVYVLRTASSREALNRREVIIEQTSSGLLVRGQRARNLGFWERLWGHNPNEQVTIKAPRQIDLSVRGVNGRVTSGDVDGSVEVKGINGRVELGQATGSAEISGINGNITVALKQLGDRGARVSGVNGNIELRLAKDLNADLTARGLNGNVRSEIAEVSVDKENHGSRYSARIGNGGSPITLSGINGNVRLTSAVMSSTPASATSEKKPASETKAATEKATKSEK